MRLHYSVHPERNPELNPDWKKTERKKYTSQADWDREQDIRDEAGGGELVFASTLIAYWNKIVITDPAMASASGLAMRGRLRLRQNQPHGARALLLRP